MNTTTIGILGEVLFDQFPDGAQLLGGAPFNVAWHLQALGQAPYVISRVGADADGATIRQAMSAWGMTCAGLQTDGQYPTGTVQISLDNGEPTYTILDKQAYDFIDASLFDHTTQYALLYHGTLALRHAQTRHALAELIAHHNGGIFLDVNLRAPWWQAGDVIAAINNADWVKLNQDEFKQLCAVSMPLPEAMRQFRTEHKLETLIVTCGSQGAMAVNSAGEFCTVTPELSLTVVDTVGAGDAFSAVLLLGQQRNWSLTTTMARAQQFASALVTQQGATVPHRIFYQAFIDAWHLD